MFVYISKITTKNLNTQIKLNKIMDKNQALTLAAVVFGLIALVHLVRAVLQWPASIGAFNVPVWLSYVTVVVAGYLAWQMYSVGKK